MAIGSFAAILVFQLWISPSNPPGFIRDEAGFSINAWSIGHHLRDQFGGFMPLYFKSFGDYKSPIFVYLLAIVFRVTGAHDSVARLVGTADVLAGLCVFAVVAYRRSRPRVALGVVVLAGFCPWLYGLGRVAYDTTLFPLAVVGVLLATDISLRSSRSLAVRCGYVALSLAFLTYCYAAGRLLAPLLAVALVVFAVRSRLRWLLGIWLGYALFLVPLGVYELRHPHGLAARFDATTFIHRGMSFGTIARDAISNYLHDLNLWHWVTGGDVRPYIDVPGYGDLFAALALLAVIGIVEILCHRRNERWWLFAVAALLLVPVPAALTSGQPDALRLSPLPLVLGVVALPGLDTLLGARAPFRYRMGIIALLAALTVAQWVQFVDVYSAHGGSDREILYEAGVPGLLSRAFAGGQTVYIDHDDVYAQTHALWYAVSHGLPERRVSILPDGGIPPKGSTAFGRVQACDYLCARYATADTYWVARALGPLPAPPTLSFRTGFNGPEEFQGSIHRWMIQNGKLAIDIHGGVAASVVISGEAFSNQQSRMLALETRTGRVVAQATVSTDQAPLTLGPFRLAPGATTLTLVATPGPARLGANDPRDASVYLSPLTVSTTY